MHLGSIRAVKLSVCLLGISACKNNKQIIVIVIVWATQPATPGKQIEIPSKQMLSLTFL